MEKGVGSLILILAMFLLVGATSSGIKVTAITPQGKNILLYRASYALVVGNGNYTNGWDPLPRIEEIGWLMKPWFTITSFRLVKDRFDLVGRG